MGQMVFSFLLSFSTVIPMGAWAPQTNFIRFQTLGTYKKEKKPAEEKSFHAPNKSKCSITCSLV